MSAPDLSRRVAAEALGTSLLVATVVGSGIMASTLTRDAGLALLGNTIPTGAILVVLILIFGPVSGAHFNPVVSLAMSWRGLMPWRDLTPFLVAQVAGGISGALAAHVMFGLPVWQAAQTVRTGSGQWFAEVVATFGLMLTVFGALRTRPEAVPVAVGLYITAAYWFTASTSFANPAVTIARAFSDSFAGIAPSSVPAFLAAQVAGAVAGSATATWLFAHDGRDPRATRT